MYKKLVQKYYLYKIFTISLPIKRHCNPTYYIMCKYLIKTTPFLNLRFLLNEFYKLIYLFNLQLNKNYILFFCSEKIFFLQADFQINKKLTYQNWFCLNKLSLINLSKMSMVACMYNVLPTAKLLYLIKDLKILSIGFMNYQVHMNFIDYIFPIESSSFTNIYFFHFTLKKFLNNVKN